MGTSGAKAFGDMLLVNKTMQTLDVSDNSFGKPVVGDEVKIKSSGETCTVFRYALAVSISHSSLLISTMYVARCICERPGRERWKSHCRIYC